MAASTETETVEEKFVDGQIAHSEVWFFGLQVNLDDATSEGATQQVKAESAQTFDIGFGHVLQFEMGSEQENVTFWLTQ